MEEQNEMRRIERVIAAFDQVAKILFDFDTAERARIIAAVEAAFGEDPSGEIIK